MSSPLRMAHHTIYVETAALSDDRIVLSGNEAVHSVKAKRIREGEEVRIIDGRGLIAIGLMTRVGREPEVEILRRESVAAISPAVRVYASTPKGSHVDDMVEALSQVGAACWVPLRTERSVVDPRTTKLDRLRRISIESAKQCGRAWLLELDDTQTIDGALMSAPETRLVVADESGESYRATGAREINLLIGPEGGFSDAELEQCRSAGAQISSFGPHAMRIEVAAPIATAVVLNAELQQSTAR